MPQRRPNAIHREWFQDTAYGVCDCGSNRRSRRKAGKDLTVYAWGEYVSARWSTVRRVCECCFQGAAIPMLRAHADPCGCSFQLVARSGHSLPPWITLEGSGIRCAA